MRFLRPLLLVAATALAGCGGGSDSNPSAGSADSNPSVGSSTTVSADALTLSSTSVTFNSSQAYGEATPETQYVHVGFKGAVYIQTRQTGPMFDHTYDENFWVEPAAGWIRIRPAAPTEVGSFTGTITVTACILDNAWPCNQVAGSPKTINVTYNVRGLSVTPAQLTFSSTGANPAMQTATLAATGGAPSYTWQVSYSPSATDWLQVRPSSGTPDLSNGPQTVMFSVNAAGLPAGVYGATVRFTNSPSFSPAMTVTLLVSDPSVNFVAPYVVPAGAGGNVIIRGRGFSGLSPDSLAVQFNSTTAVSAVVVSDTEIRATYPPLGAGSYSILVRSGATSIPSRAALKLVVVDPPAFRLTTIPRPASAGEPANLIYDAERQALFFTDPANNRILRYALSGNGDASLDTGWPVGRIALSPDGTELIRAAPQAQLFRLDPATLAVLSSVDTVPSLRLSGLYSLGFANDGGALTSGWFAGDHVLYRYDMLTRAFTPVSFQYHLSSRPIVASADGNMLVLPYPGPSATDTRVYTYDASTGALTPRAATTTYFRGLSTSRNGSRVLLTNGFPWTRTIYDREFNALATLPLPDNAIPLAIVLSPDGNFAYGYNSTEGRVRKFNVAPSGVTEVGSGSVVAPARTEMSEMTISPDGGTLFLVGKTSVVIAPAP